MGIVFLTLSFAVISGKPAPICLWVGVFIFVQSILIYAGAFEESPAGKEGQGDCKEPLGKGFDADQLVGNRAHGGVVDGETSAKRRESILVAQDLDP